MKKLFSLLALSLPASTDLPSTVGTTPMIKLLKSAGTTNRTVDVDYFFMKQILTSAR